jgi:hypothetical protein
MPDNVRLPNLLRLDEAQKFGIALGDQPARRVFDRLFVMILKRWQSGKDLPVADLDVRFLYSLMAELFSKPEELQRILSGENVDEWHNDNT